MNNINKLYKDIMSDLSKTNKEEKASYNRARKLQEEVTKNIRHGRCTKPWLYLPDHKAINNTKKYINYTIKTAKLAKLQKTFMQIFKFIFYKK